MIFIFGRHCFIDEACFFRCLPVPIYSIGHYFMFYWTFFIDRLIRLWLESFFWRHPDRFSVLFFTFDFCLCWSLQVWEGVVLCSLGYRSLRPLVTYPSLIMVCSPSILELTLINALFNESWWRNCYRYTKWYSIITPKAQDTIRRIRLDWPKKWLLKWLPLAQLSWYVTLQVWGGSRY